MMIQHKMLLAETIIHKVIQDLCDRNGFDDWWYAIDVRIREGIIVELCLLVHNTVGKHEEAHE